MGNRRLAKKPGILFVVLVLLSSSAWAIVIQDTTQPGYVTGNNNFTGVVQILFDTGNPANQSICSGSLVAPNLILTAGHCISGAENWQVTFQTASGNTVRGVTSTSLDPDFGPRGKSPLYNGTTNVNYTQLDQYDVGFLKLNGLAPGDAQVYSPDTIGPIVGEQLDIVGYGIGGNPAAGFLGTGTRRRAENIVTGTVDGSQFGDTCAACFPDHPFRMDLTFQNPCNAGCDPNQGLINGGDSGGPALSGNLIEGVASFGNLPRPGQPGNPMYQNGVGYSSGHEILSDPNIASYVENYIESMAVPEPRHVAFLMIGLLGLLGLKRRLQRN